MHGKPRKKPFLVLYDDGEEEFLDLRTEKWRPLDRHATHRRQHLRTWRNPALPPLSPAVTLAANTPAPVPAPPAPAPPVPPPPPPAAPLAAQAHNGMDLLPAPGTRASTAMAAERAAAPVAAQVHNGVDLPAIGKADAADPASAPGVSSGNQGSEAVAKLLPLPVAAAEGKQGDEQGKGQGDKQRGKQWDRQGDKQGDARGGQRGSKRTRAGQGQEQEEERPQQQRRRHKENADGQGIERQARTQLEQGALGGLRNGLGEGAKGTDRKQRLEEESGLQQGRQKQVEREGVLVSTARRTRGQAQVQLPAPLPAPQVQDARQHGRGEAAAIEAVARNKGGAQHARIAGSAAVTGQGSLTKDATVARAAAAAAAAELVTAAQALPAAVVRTVQSASARATRTTTTAVTTPAASPTPHSAVAAPAEAVAASFSVPGPGAEAEAAPSAVPGPELVGQRVEVWWPDDKAFYKGTVKEHYALTVRACCAIRSCSIGCW